jgi:hypothetical protein
MCPQQLRATCAALIFGKRGRQLRRTKTKGPGIARRGLGYRGIINRNSLPPASRQIRGDQKEESQGGLHATGTLPALFHRTGGLSDAVIVARDLLLAKSNPATFRFKTSQLHRKPASTLRRGTVLGQGSSSPRISIGSLPKSWQGTSTRASPARPPVGAQRKAPPVRAPSTCPTWWPTPRRIK